MLSVADIMTDGLDDHVGPSLFRVRPARVETGALVIGELTEDHCRMNVGPCRRCAIVSASVRRNLRLSAEWREWSQSTGACFVEHMEERLSRNFATAEQRNVWGQRLYVEPLCARLAQDIDKVEKSEF